MEKKYLAIFLIIFTSFIFLKFISADGRGKMKIINPAEAQTASTDWPQCAHDAQRTGYSAETLGVASSPSVTGRHVFQPERVSPQVQAIIYTGSDGIRRVYVGTENGSLYALNPVTGATLWKFSISGPIVSSVAAANNAIFFGAMDGSIYGVNAATGTQSCRTNTLTDRGFVASPVFADNMIMLGGQNGVFYAMDTNCNIVWQKDIGSPILQTAAANSGKVYFSARNNMLYALSTTSSGSQIWSKTIGDANGWPAVFKDYWPVVFNNKIFIKAMVRGSNSFFALNENDGNFASGVTLPQKQSMTMNGAAAAPCIRNGYLITQVDKGSYGGAWGEVNPSNGSVVSVIDLGFGSEDEGTNISCAGNALVSFHIQESNPMLANAGYATGMIDMNTRTWIDIASGQTNLQMSTGGGGGGNPASISGGYLYHISINELIIRRTN